MFRIITVALLSIFGALAIAGETYVACRDAGNPTIGHVLACLVAIAGCWLSLWNGAKSTVELVDREFDEEKNKRARAV